jgi:membrane protein YdbS with pleckstrin-like domain
MTKGTDFNILQKGLKQLGILLLLLITSPLALSFAFKALRIYKEGTPYIWSIVFLVFAALLTLFTIFYAFRTFRTILSSLFHDK